MKHKTKWLSCLLLCVGLAQAQLIGNNSFPDGTAPPNDAPVWNNTPDPTCVAGVASSEAYAQWVGDPDDDPLTFVNETGCTLPTGVTINNTTKALDCADTTSAGTTTSCVHSADDGTAAKVDSAAFSIVISDVSSPTVWQDYNSTDRVGAPGAIEIQP